MRTLLLLFTSLVLFGCDNFPDSLAEHKAQGEYRGFSSELRVEDPLYEGLHHPDDGAIAAHEVFRLWGVDGLPKLDKVWSRLDDTKVLVVSNEATRKACLTPEDASAPFGCMYAYQDKPRAIINAERAPKDHERRMGLLCHEFIHAAAWRAYLVPDYAHERPELWAKAGGKESLEYRCRQKAFVKSVQRTDQQP